MPLTTLEKDTLPPRPRPPATGRQSGRFLMMVCDAAQRYLLAAETAMVSGHRPSATANILRAQSILVEMMGSVDHDVLSDLADAHACVFQRLIDGLSDALHHRDPALVRAVRALLLEYQDAWAGASSPFAPEPFTGDYPTARFTADASRRREHPGGVAGSPRGWAPRRSERGGD